MRQNNHQRELAGHDSTDGERRYCHEDSPRRLPHRSFRPRGASGAICLTGLLAGMLAVPAQAQQAGSLIVSSGWMHVAPQVRTDAMTSAISMGDRRINRTDAAISAQVRAANTIGLTATYFITDHLAGEMVAGLPPRFAIQGAGSAERYGQLGSARMWSPTVLLKYYFGNASGKFRPFVGVGASYVWFTDSKVSNDAFQREKLLGPTRVSVSKGLSPVLNAGLSYEFADRWYAGLSISYIPMRRTITLTTPNAALGRMPASISSQISTRLNPIVTYVNVGYRF